jgi:HdeA/HdeB family protein
MTWLESPTRKRQGFREATLPGKGRAKRGEVMVRALRYGVLAVLVAGAAGAQVHLNRPVIKLDTLICKDLVSLSREEKDRLLIYLNGYFDGRHQILTWDERVTGERIDQALGTCQAQPETPVLRAFRNAWPQ